MKGVEVPVGTVGESQKVAEASTGLDPEIADRISQRMGLSSPRAKASSYEGGVQVLEFVTQEQAKARLAEIAKEGVK